MQKRKSRIGIFGGTFDPPHIGHLILAEYVRDEMKLDEIWLAPASDPPHKLDRKKTPAKIRMKMVKLLCGNDPFIKASDIDIIHGRKPSYTIDLLDDLRKKFPQCEFYLIIGADSVLEFKTWRRWREILKKHKIVAINRPGRSLGKGDTEILKAITLLHNPLIEISSSDIRDRIRQGKSVRHMIPEKVLEYIVTRELYKNHSGK